MTDIAEQGASKLESPKDSAPMLPRLTRPLQPLVDLVAHINVSVHIKLLAGFLGGALLLLGMGILSTVVLDQMSEHNAHLITLQQRVDHVKDMRYDLMAQNHAQSMFLLTHDTMHNDNFVQLRDDFQHHLDALERMPGRNSLLTQVAATDRAYLRVTARVLSLYRAGRLTQAMQLHLNDVHMVATGLDRMLTQLDDATARDMAAAHAAFTTGRALLMMLVKIFSVISLSAALLLGFILSWAVILPVRRIDRALGLIAAGDFAQSVEIPNRDELGTLSSNLNKMSRQLVTMYDQVWALNAVLQHTVEEQVTELERSKVLRQFLSPQLVDSILRGDLEVNLAPKRKNLTVFFSDIRGFTALSERMEPEELVEVLNDYLTAMTEVVFKYGGTLDKYIGDSIMVFFGDPVPLEDHAERSVKMAVEMRARLTQLRKQQWLLKDEHNLSIGMGISTGYVTVGSIGSADRRDYTVYGPYVNLASRLSARAEPNQILVAEKTWMAVRDVFETREVDQIELKGISRPIKIYEIVEQRRARRRSSKEQVAALIERAGTEKAETATLVEGELPAEAASTALVLPKAETIGATRPLQWTGRISDVAHVQTCAPASQNVSLSAREGKRLGWPGQRSRAYALLAATLVAIIVLAVNLAPHGRKQSIARVPAPSAVVLRRAYQRTMAYIATHARPDDAIVLGPVVDEAVHLAGVPFNLPAYLVPADSSAATGRYLRAVAVGRARLWLLDRVPTPGGGGAPLPVLTAQLARIAHAQTVIVDATNELDDTHMRLVLYTLPLLPASVEQVRPIPVQLVRTLAPLGPGRSSSRIGQPGTTAALAGPPLIPPRPGRTWSFPAVGGPVTGAVVRLTIVNPNRGATQATVQAGGQSIVVRVQPSSAMEIALGAWGPHTSRAALTIHASAGVIPLRTVSTHAVIQFTYGLPGVYWFGQCVADCP